jgi:hypothetical protein
MKAARSCSFSVRLYKGSELENPIRSGCALGPVDPGRPLHAVAQVISVPAASPNIAAPVTALPADRRPRGYLSRRPVGLMFGIVGGTNAVFMI